MRRRYAEEPSGPNDTAWNDTVFLRIAKENAARQLERDIMSKCQYLPKSDGRATQILHDVVVNMTFTVGKENDDRDSAIGVMLLKGIEQRQEVYLSVLQLCSMIASAR
jgi:hypothetical protein